MLVFPTRAVPLKDDSADTLVAGRQCRCLATAPASPEETESDPTSDKKHTKKTAAAANHCRYFSANFFCFNAPGQGLSFAGNERMAESSSAARRQSNQRGPYAPV
jgi:hypothetical protein